MFVERKSAMRIRIVAIVTGLILFSPPVFGQYRFYIYEKTDRVGVTPWVRYTKIDGVFGGLSGYVRPFGSLVVSGKAGYGFAGRDARFQVAAQQSFSAGNHEFAMAVDYADLAVTHDTLVIRDWQNSLAALTIHQDYYNYYRVRGFHVRCSANLDGTYRFFLTGGAPRYSSLTNATRFALSDWKAVTVNGKKTFAPNPAVTEGRDYYVGLAYEVDFRPSPNAFVSAWYLQGSYTNSRWLHKSMHSDFSYHHANLVFKRYQKLYSRQRLAVTLRILSYQGSTSDSSGAASDQFLFDMGGYGTLRGYGYRELQNGNRSVLVSADYLFNGSFLPKTFLARTWGLKAIFKNFDLILFADAGHVWSLSEDRSFLDFSGVKPARWRVDAGLGLAMSDWIRVECALPLKDSPGSRAGNPIFYLKIAQRL